MLLIFPILDRAKDFEYFTDDGLKWLELYFHLRSTPLLFFHFRALCNAYAEYGMVQSSSKSMEYVQHALVTSFLLDVIHRSVL